MKKLLLQLFFLALFSVLLNVGSAQEYHVSTTGDDDANGSAANPWQTIQHAMDNVSAGSIVYVHEGTYFERLYVNASGAEGAYIVFQNFGTDEVIIDGTGTTDPALIEVYNVHHIVLDGFILRNNYQLDAMGVLVEGACDHIQLANLEVYNIGFSTDPNAPVSEETNAQPIIVYGTDDEHTITDLSIVNCELHDCQLGYSEALAVNGNVEGFEISGNQIHHMSNIGIDIIGHEDTCEDPSLDQARQGLVSNNKVYFCTSPYASAAGIYVDGARQIIIEKNEVYGCDWGIEVGCENTGESASEILVRNNFVYNNLDSGIAVGGYSYPDGSGKVTEVTITYNTLYNNGLFVPYNGEIYLTYVENGQIINNIVYIDNGSAIAVGADGPTAQNLLFNNNLIYTEQGANNTLFDWYDDSYEGMTNFINGTGYCSSCLTENPLFVFDGLDADLHLTSDSPAIDQGEVSEFMGEQDIDGEQRSFGFGPDLGADEFGSVVGTNDIKNLLPFTIYPNPASDFFALEYSFAGALTLTISDAQGRSIRSLNVRSMEQIDVRDLSPGVYLVMLREGNNRSWTTQFVKH